MAVQGSYSRKSARTRVPIRPDSSRSALLVSLYACHVPGWYITSRLSDADVCPTVGGERPASLIYPSPRLLQGKRVDIQAHQTPNKSQGMMAREKKKEEEENILLRRISFRPWKEFSFSSLFFFFFPLFPSCFERCSCILERVIVCFMPGNSFDYRFSVGRNFKRDEPTVKRRRLFQ